jgi:hypothetical protein
VGVVGREHEQLGTCLLDHPADRLPGERGELEVPAHIVRGPLRQVSQWLLGPSERALAVVEMVQPGHDPARTLLDAPASKTRVPVEEPVEDECAEEHLG